MAKLWILGVVMASIGNVVSNFGSNLQKYSIKQNMSLDGANVSYNRQPAWIGGLLLIILGNLGDFTALTFTAQSIISPIASLTLIVNMFFSYCYLNEPITQKTSIGTALIVLGSVVTVATGDHNSYAYDDSDFSRLFSAAPFIIYISLTIALMIFMYIICEEIGSKKKLLIESEKKFTDASQTDDDSMKASTYADLVANIKNFNNRDMIYSTVLSTLSGMFGAVSAMFGKVIAILFANTLADNNELNSATFWISLIVVVTTIFLQFKYTAKAMTYYDISFVMPVFQCAYICFSTIGGLCLFEEFYVLDAVQLVFFVIGLIIILIGLGVMVVPPKTIQIPDIR